MIAATAARTAAVWLESQQHAGGPMVGVPLEHLAAVPAATSANGRSDSAAQFVVWVGSHAFDAGSGAVFDPASGVRLTAESTATLAGAAHRLFRYDISRPVGRNLVRHVDVAAAPLHAVAQVAIHWLVLGEIDAAGAAAARIVRDAAAASSVSDVHARALASVFCRQWAMATKDPAAGAASTAWLDAAAAGAGAVDEPAAIAAVAWAAAVAAQGADDKAGELRALTSSLVRRLSAAQSADGAWRGPGVASHQVSAATFASTAWASYRLACTSAALAIPAE